MRYFIINFIFVILGLNCLAGSGPSYLKCKSESGKTIFNAQLNNLDWGLESAEFIIDKFEINFDFDDSASIVVDLDNGVYTLTIRSKEKEEDGSSYFIKLWGIPSTFKAIINERNKIKYEFKAKIQGTDPRPDKKFSPTIELNCTLEWEI